MTPAEVLKQRRHDLGIGQRELARRLGISQSVVSEMENSKRDIRLSTLQRWARALGAQLVIEIEP